MKKLIFLLLLPVQAFALQNITPNQWTHTTAVTQKIETYCDCVVTETNGSFYVDIRMFYARYLRDNVMYCHKMNPSEFFKVSSEGWYPLFNVLLGSPGGQMWTWTDVPPADLDPQCLK